MGFLGIPSWEHRFKGTFEDRWFSCSGFRFGGICDRSGEGNLLIPKDSEKKSARFGETDGLEGPKLNDFLGQKYPTSRPVAYLCRWTLEGSVEPIHLPSSNIYANVQFSSKAHAVDPKRVETNCFLCYLFRRIEDYQSQFKHIKTLKVFEFLPTCVLYPKRSHLPFSSHPTSPPILTPKAFRPAKT